MNREWSELNKTLQIQLKRRDTFAQGIETLLDLRGMVMETLLSLKAELTRADFNAMPFINAEGYHNKTIAYSIWHIFRIEDIVAHTVISGDEQVFFAGGYQERINSPIVTTGNELVKRRIAEFSERLNLDELYAYIKAVKESTDEMLKSLDFEAMKQRIPSGVKACPELLKSVSGDDNAAWLIDYWCGKDIRGLIQMPFSRHWIMHTEACLRIMKGLLHNPRPK